MNNPELKEVTFAQLLHSDEMIVCKHFTLSNSINNYGIDFTQPMLFNDFLFNIGKCLTSMNCKSLFEQAEWYIWTN